MAVGAEVGALDLLAAGCAKCLLGGAPEVEPAVNHDLLAVGGAESIRAAYGEEIVGDGRLDLWSAAEQALRAAGCEQCRAAELCTYCHPEPSSRTGATARPDPAPGGHWLHRLRQSGAN